MDNAVYALVSMNRSFPGKFLETIFELVVNHFPMRVDFYEEDSVIRFFEFVMKTNSRLFLQGADRIVRGYGQRLAVQEFSQEVENLMKGHIQFIQNQNPMEFGNLLNSLPIEERQEISNLLQNCCVCWISQFLLISVLLVP